MRRDNNRGRVDALLGAADEAVSLTAVETALISCTGTCITRWDALNAGGNAIPGIHFLWQHGQFAALAGERLLCPEAKFRHTPSLLRRQLAACPLECGAEPAMDAEIAAAPGQIRHRQLTLECCLHLWQDRLHKAARRLLVRTGNYQSPGTAALACLHLLGQPLQRRLQDRSIITAANRHFHQ